MLQAVMILVLAIAILAILRAIASRSNNNGRYGEDDAATIRCPNCGSPAKRRGDSWECPWCGDSGRIIRR